MAFDCDSWHLLHASPEQAEGQEAPFDAAEGMAVADGRVFVVDTAAHRVVSFDAATLTKVGQYPPQAWTEPTVGQRWDSLLKAPTGIAHYDGELFVSDTHNDRVQVPPRLPAPPCPAPPPPAPHLNSSASDRLL